MAIIFSDEILKEVDRELKDARESVQIITAYCKENALRHIDNCIQSNIKDKRLLVRFKMNDIIKGSTDFSILEYAMSTGWKLFIRFDLHAKTYIVDNKRGLVGSANATNAGLNMNHNGNLEMATIVDVEPLDVEKINKLFNDAILVDKEILTNMKEQLDKVTSNTLSEQNTWDSSITSLFQPNVETLFSYELPEEFSFSEGEYCSFLDETYMGNKDNMKESFRWSNAYIWLLNNLKENNGCLYFGTLTEKLHNALVTDPKPYRRDVKQMLSNLLVLIEMLNMDEVVVDRPNYSQRVRLVEIVE